MFNRKTIAAALDEKTALMRTLRSLNTRMAAMKSGVVRLSMIAAMVMLRDFADVIVKYAIGGTS